LTSNSLQVIGSAHNGIEYLVEALDFLARGEVKPMIEVFPADRIAEAYDRVVEGKIRFKAVITF
jgi:D-arabinose 1-dehydrogenase-like Zn-dependent alcohol dehydrogenase